tara:strand:+ start:461 stop:1213 length:753 start_codon:yes stop_codon:yes gene_type:complete
MSVIKDILLPAAATYLLGPVGGGITNALGLGGSAAAPIINRAITGALVSGLTGGSPIQGALMGGITGGLDSSFTGQDQQQTGGKKAPKISTTKSSTTADTKGGSFLGPPLRALGLNEDSMFFKLANTPVGAALLTGGIAQLLAGDDDDDPLPAQDYRKFGSAAGFESIPLIDFSKQGSVLTANRGGTIFPRRDGAIMPYEGGGNVDDVPAMLTAGEFVLTKDAVKGLGGGDQNKGIQRAYDMMSNLERMA